ncbi:hypothetical protein OKW45_000559 [Paraburkholderia sp. WSM4175]
MANYATCITDNRTAVVRAEPPPERRDDGATGRLLVADYRRMGWQSSAVATYAPKVRCFVIGTQANSSPRGLW